MTPGQSLTGQTTRQCIAWNVLNNGTSAQACYAVQRHTCNIYIQLC